MLAFIEKALNSYLNLDPDSGKRLAILDGKIVKIHLLKIEQQFYLRFTEKEVHLSKTSEVDPDTTITGTPLRLLQMALTRENRKRFFAEDIRIEGNLECGNEITALFDEMEIDREEILSGWIGDESANFIGRVARKMQAFVRHARETVTLNVNEYIHEEKRWFPAREATIDFFHDVDALRMDTDRLAARITLLTERIAAKRKSS